MKRYNVANFGRTSDGMEEDSYGRFVLHSEAQARIEALEAALRGLLDNAVVLLRAYLKTFKDCPADATIQGWDKARWLRAADAKDVARAALENSNEPR